MIVGKGAEMIAVLRNNRYIRRRKKSYKELRKQFVSQTHAYNTTYTKADPELLKKIRKKVIRQNRIKFLKDSIALLISVAIVVYLAILILK